MRLDSRLRLVASLIRRGSRVADIGTDHAYLPVWLMGQGHCPSAVASDIRTGPVSRAEKTVAEAGLSARVSVRLGSGLTTVSPDEADDIVIAGMGGETIASILDETPWVKDARFRFILQPMTRPELLREYLLKSGFCLTEERIAADGRRQYLVLSSQFDPDAAAAQLTDPAVFYKGILDPTEYQAYLTKQRNRLQHAAEAQRKAGHAGEAEKLDAIVALL